MKILNELIEVMKPFQYGFPDQDGSNMIESNPLKYDRDFARFYYLQTPEELALSQCGVCWDQVEFERDFLEKEEYLSKPILYVLMMGIIFLRIPSW